MLFTTHMCATNLLILSLNASPGNAALAYAFGVGVDLDHLLPLVYSNDVRALRKEGRSLKQLYMHEPIAMHTPLHEPVGLGLVSLFSYLASNPVAFLSYGSHFLLDQVMLKSPKQPLFPFKRTRYTYGLVGRSSIWEIGLSLILLAVTSTLVFNRYF